MKKFSLFLISFILCCTNVVWADAVPSGELFGTYQAKDVILPLDNGTDPQNIGVDCYIATCGQTVMLRAISTGETTFGGAGWETQLRVETGARKEVQACTVVSNKNHYTGNGCSKTITTKEENLMMHFFVSGSYPTGVAGGYRKTADFPFNRKSINAPIIDDVAPVLDVENTTYVDNGDGTITVTFGGVTADDEFFYYVGDKDHDWGDISLDNVLTLTKPTALDGTKYTLRAYAVDFNGNKSAYKEYSYTMPFDVNTNLALTGKSSAGYWENSTYTPDKANDGNTDTRWNSWGYTEGNNWWMVKLQNTYVITSIKANYRDVGGSYLYEGSVDGQNWTTFSEGSLSNDDKTPTYAIGSLSAQYIRFSSSRYATVNEFEVYGSGLAALDKTAPELTLSEVGKTINTATIGVVATDKDDAGNEGIITSIRISDVANGLAETEYISSWIDNQITVSGLNYNTTYNFKVVVADAAGNTTEKTISIVLPFNENLNLALNKPCTGGHCQFGDQTPEGKAAQYKKANDGDISTTYSAYGAPSTDDAWWQVDLEAIYKLSHVDVTWANNFSTGYMIYGSYDGINWFVMATDAASEAGKVSTSIVAGTRFVKIHSYNKASVVIAEVEVYATGFGTTDTTAPVISTFTITPVDATSVSLHVEATDVDDENNPQPLTYKVNGNNDFVEQAIVLDADNNATLTGLKKNRDYTFTVTATDPVTNSTTSDPVDVRMVFDATDNLALNKPCEAGCAESESRGAAKANDGNASTSWGTYNCVQNNKTATWEEANIWSVDLGTIFDIDRILFTSAGAEGKQHPTIIYASCDNINWYVAVAEQTVAENQSYDNTSVNVPARYLKLQATGNGMIAIKEFEVYGLGYSTTDNVAPQVTITEISKTTNSATLQIDATDEDDASVSHPVKSIRISGNNGFTTIENAVLDANNQIVLDGLKENTSYQFKVLVTDRVGLTVEDDIEVRVTFDPAQNLALNKPCEAGIHQDANVASRANDGKEDNFWTCFGTGTSDQWWWKVDLGASFNIHRVRILFNDHSGTYNLFSSEDGETWSDYATNFTIDNDHKDYSINVVTSTRYFKFTSTAANVGIKEFEVYGTGYNDGDEEAPVITAATLVGEAEENSAVVSVTATDNVGVYSCRFVDATNSYDQTYEYVAGENITVTGLVPSTTYNFTITASDRAENVSEGFAMAAFTTKANDNVPHVAAPAPQHSQLEVISIYSDKFTSAVKTPFSWTSWGGATVKTEGNIGGNSYVHYVFGGHGEIGIGDKFKDVTTNEEGINVSTKKSLHIDIWSLTNDQINITLNDQTVASNLQLVAGEWTSFNIDLASFTTEHLDILTALKWMKFTACQNKTIAVDNIYFYTEVTDITLEQTADNSLIISSFDDREMNVTLNRSFIADGYWYTLCLPFSLTAEQLAEAYGADYDLRYLASSYMKSEDMMYLNFEKATELQAGMPYMFKPTGTSNENYGAKTFTGVVIDNSNPVQVTDVATMTGYYSPMVVDATNYALGSDNYLYHTDGTTSNAFRCYFTLNPPTSAPVQARCVFNESQVVTNLDEQSAINNQQSKMILDGRLVIIRDGKMYNAQGARL